MEKIYCDKCKKDVEWTKRQTQETIVSYFCIHCNEEIYEGVY